MCEVENGNAWTGAGVGVCVGAGMGERDGGEEAEDKLNEAEDEEPEDEEVEDEEPEEKEVEPEGEGGSSSTGVCAGTGRSAFLDG